MKKTFLIFVISFLVFSVQALPVLPTFGLLTTELEKPDNVVVITPMPNGDLDGNYEGSNGGGNRTAQSAQVSVENQWGTVVFSIVVNAGGSFVVPASSFPSGAYLVKATFANGATKVVYKLVK
jgi:hypothetical protein